MLQTIRDRATGWFAYIVLGLIILTFALFGIEQYVGGGGPLDAAEVNGEAISQQQFQQGYQRERQRAQALLGDRLDEAQLKREVLERMIDERLLEQFVRSAGLRIGDDQLQAAIFAIEAFKLPDGQFSKDLYERALRQQGYSPQGFQEMLRASLAIDQLREGVGSTVLLTPHEQQRLVELAAQRRELAVLRLSLDAARHRQTPPTEAELEAYYQQHAQRYVDPERVKLEYLELKLDALAGDAMPTEDAIRAAYDERRADFVKPEERAVSHILVRLPENPTPEQVEQAEAKAQALHARLASGRVGFDALVKEIREGQDATLEAGDLGTLAQGVMDPSFDQALFALKAVGDLSEPVRTDFGFHLIRVDGITPEHAQPLDEVRAQLVQALRRQQAERRFFEAADKLSSLAFENPDSLAPVAQALGLRLETSGWLTREGDGGPLFGNPRLMEAAFGDEVLRQGRNSEPVQLAPDDIVVVRVAEHQDAKPLGLDDARERVLADLGEARAREALAQAAQALRERLLGGSAPAEAAQAAQAGLEQPGMVRRNAPGIDPAVLREAFRLNPPAAGKPAVGGVELAGGDRAVVVVRAVEAGKTEDLELAEREALFAQVRAQLGQAELRGLVDELRRNARIATHPDRL